MEFGPATGGAREAAETQRGGRMKATTCAVLLAIVGVLVGLLAAVIGRFYL